MANKNKGNNSEGSKQAKLNKQKSDDVKDYSSFKTVLFYCSLIVFLPVVTFFFLNTLVLDRFFILTETKSNIYSAVGAVLALHFALALYIYRAYFGGSTQRQKAD
ncbi:vacuolar ATPase assembly integral membrane protein VMA21 homolog [Lucilia cuprina]|uniref:vacuolar ATPase assembly integral membrane protein VMA21 homolog n=1 Tax=Lucilia cuprina TaxID=7375 RepID=UPI000C719EDC|nr:vacuolar ATPase assembly integral membrane protein VMA21 homolog [Lucilia cuprina]KAI8117289.1 Vacuolar ATPase assembly integral membrane protein VMA21 like protein [Lucilia cuprina]